MCAGRVGRLPRVYRRGKTREREFAVERFLQRSKSLQVCAWAFSIIAGLAGLAPAGHAQVVIPATAATEVVAGTDDLRLYGGAAARRDMGDPEGDGGQWLINGYPAGSREAALDSGAVLVQRAIDNAGRIFFAAYALVGPDEPTFGWSVAGRTDLNGDGATDIVVGAPGANMNAGKVYIYSGRTRALAFTIDSPVAGGRFGESVCSAADFDGDGVSDIMVGAPKAGAGAVYVYSGRTHNLIRTYTAPLGARNFGRYLDAFAVPEANAVGVVIGCETSAQANVWEAKSYRYMPPAPVNLQADPGDPLCETLPNECERQFCQDVTSAEQSYASTMSSIARDRSNLPASRSRARSQALAAYRESVGNALAAAQRQEGILLLSAAIAALQGNVPALVIAELGLIANQQNFRDAVAAAQAALDSANTAANQEFQRENARLNNAEDSSLQTLNSAINAAMRRKCGCKRRLNIQPEPGECDEPPLNP